MSHRVDQWCCFRWGVLRHIRDYANKQYGDYPNDPITQWELSDFKTALGKYVARIGSNARGQEEAKRDCYKIAHIACVMMYKIIENTPAD